ncbi:MAG: hypothetical protein ACRDVW_03680 [Acidimicrobiales bacterium]
MAVLRRPRHLRVVVVAVVTIRRPHRPGAGGLEARSRPDEEDGEPAAYSRDLARLHSSGHPKGW